MFSEVINNIEILQIVPFFVLISPAVTMVINNYNMTFVEKIMLTNMKKIIHSLVMIVFYSLCIGGLLSLLSVIIPAGLNLDGYLEVFAFSSILAFLLLVIFFGVLFSLINKLRIKTTFYIKDEKGRKWYVVRRVNKNHVLFKGKKNRVMFFEPSYIYKSEIFLAIVEREKKYFELNSKKEKWLIIISIILLLGIQFILLIPEMEFYHLLIYSVVYTASALTIVVSLVSKGNKKIKQQFAESRIEGN